MTSQRFSIGTQIIYNAVVCEVVSYSPENDQIVTLEEVDGGATIKRKLNTLVDALFKGELKFITKTRINRKKETSSIPNPEELKIDLSDYPPHLVEIARFRLKAITPLLIMETNRTKESYENRIIQLQEEADEKGYKISTRSLYRWISDYDAGGCEIRCLIPNTKKRGGVGESRLPEDVLALIDSVIKEKIKGREKITTHTVMTLIAQKMEIENRFRPSVQQMKVPTEVTINKRLDTLDVRLRLNARYGKRKAGWMIKQVGKTKYPDLPLERVEFDHTKIDLIVVDDDNLLLGRPTLSFALDMATRYPLGYYLGFEPPSYYTVLECLYHAISPKPDVKKMYNTEHDWIAYGIPNNLVTDQGKEFIGKDLSDACESLGIIIDTAPIKTPQFKGGIERNFGTLNTGFFHQIDGTTFSNYLEKGDYDSEKQACVSLKELEASLAIHIVDEYCEKYHHGLEGVPARRWEYALKTNFLPRFPPDNETLRILLGRMEYRVIQKYGIDFENIRYNCQDLAYLRLKKAGEKVKIKYHPGDLSRVYVFNEFENIYIEVPSIDQDYTENLSLWKHKVIKHFGKINGDNEDLAALGRAKVKIQQIVEEARNRSKLSGRSKIKRFDDGGKPASLHNNQDKPAKPTKSLPEPQNITAIKNDLKNVEFQVSDTALEGWELANGINLIDR